MLLSTSIAAISSSRVVSAWQDGLVVGRWRFWGVVGRRQGFAFKALCGRWQVGLANFARCRQADRCFWAPQPELSLSFTYQWLPSKWVCGLTMLFAGVRQWQVGRSSTTFGARRWAAHEVWWVCLALWLSKQPCDGVFLGQGCCLRRFVIVPWRSNSSWPSPRWAGPSLSTASKPQIVQSYQVPLIFFIYVN